MPAGSEARRRGLSLDRLLTLGDHTDEHGRLLLEDSASRGAQKRVKRAGVAMRSERCRYPDSPSRQGGEMNVSAYEALRRDLGEVLDGFGWLAERYLQLNPTGRTTVQGLLDVSNLGTTVPLVLFHRSEQALPAHGSLPSPVASIFKASRGIFSAAIDMLNQSSDPAATVSVVDVVGFAEAHGHFRRAETGRVCAAPTRLIERVIDAILTGQGADPTRSVLGELVDFADLWAFYVRHNSFSQASSTYKFVLNNLTKAGDVPPERLFGATVQVEGRSWSFGDFTRAFVDHANAVQAELNSVLGRADPGPALAMEAVLRIL
ncbi:MAG TPA: hypothetical protein VK975_04635 [Acidimicrobiales bacterium]|nr:hypothetical protein [Acidimicrobiales bacterium]